MNTIVGEINDISSNDILEFRALSPLVFQRVTPNAPAGKAPTTTRKTLTVFLFNSRDCHLLKHVCNFLNCGSTYGLTQFVIPRSQGLWFLSFVPSLSTILRYNTQSGLVVPLSTLIKTSTHSLHCCSIRNEAIIIFQQ